MNLNCGPPPPLQMISYSTKYDPKRSTPPHMEEIKVDPKKLFWVLQCDFFSGTWHKEGPLCNLTALSFKTEVRLYNIIHWLNILITLVHPMTLECCGIF